MSPELKYAPRTEEKREIWSMKISPRLKYLAGIASRADKKTLAAYVEDALLKSFEHIWVIKEDEDDDGTISPGKTLAQMADELYAGSEADRFITMAEVLPWLFSDGESRLMRVLQHSRYYCPPRKPMRVDRIREQWQLLAAIRDGADISILPESQRPSEALAFGLKGDAERTALYKSDPEAFKRENEAYKKAMKGKVK